MKIRVTTTFGLEAVAKRELMALGYENLTVRDGKIVFEGDARAVARANIHLRTAERVKIELAEFPARTYDELFEAVKRYPWEELLPEDANFHMMARAHASALMSPADIQSISERALVDAMRRKYPRERFAKSGAHFPIEVELYKDIATVTLDTSGEGLHKRGYRERAGDAPIKETLAAAMVLLSFWNGARTLWDPFCGSGTIPLEAAMIAKNIAPGIDRAFAAEKFPTIGKEIFDEVRREAFAAIKLDERIHIMGSDIDKRNILRARDNADELGLKEEMTFFMKDFREVDLLDDYGVIITNPPLRRTHGREKRSRRTHARSRRKNARPSHLVRLHHLERRRTRDPLRQTCRPQKKTLQRPHSHRLLSILRPPPRHTPARTRRPQTTRERKNKKNAKIKIAKIKNPRKKDAHHERASFLFFSFVNFLSLARSSSRMAWRRGVSSAVISAMTA